jgi:trans-aconitate 2-methyltransferase
VSANSAPVDWDAETYHEISDFQYEWGCKLLDRLELRGDETVLDAGCGTGRVTKELLDRLPHGRVIAVDASPSMVEKARANLDGRAEMKVAQLTELQLDEPVDAVFSSSVFHWIPDHDALFGRLAANMRPGAQLAARLGVEGNAAHLIAAVAEVGAEERFAAAFDKWEGAWNFAPPESVVAALEGAGFIDVVPQVERTTVQPKDGFLRVVALPVHLERLPEPDRAAFVDSVAARCPEPLTIQHVQLHVVARRGES